MFGDILRELREDIKWTQEELSKKLNVSRQAISNYEKGDTEPNIDTLVRLADIFNVSLDYLLGRTKQRINLQIGNEVLLSALNDKNRRSLLIDIAKSILVYNIAPR